MKDKMKAAMAKPAFPAGSAMVAARAGTGPRRVRVLRFSDTLHAGIGVLPSCCTVKQDLS
jgi:hypothetical protein